jgi:aerobic-type carbon monoxide dehydrogenase small subunit (CoxS/CutS family)
LRCTRFSPRIDKELDRGRPFEFTVDGRAVKAYPGETIAGALLAAGRLCFRRTAKIDHPRGFYCGMGICWECTMIVNGEPNVRTCLTLAEPGMQVQTQFGFGLGDKE